MHEVQSQSQLVMLCSWLCSLVPELNVILKYARQSANLLCSFAALHRHALHGCTRSCILPIPAVAPMKKQATFETPLQLCIIDWKQA